jgi:hypothetical protein
MDHGTPSTAHEDMRIVRAAIHPSIGIARVGNSEREYYIGPEVPAPLPAHLRQDKLYIKENEGILHEVKLFPCAYRRNLSCNCP